MVLESDGFHEVHLVAEKMLEKEKNLFIYLFIVSDLSFWEFKRTKESYTDGAQLKNI